MKRFFLYHQRFGDFEVTEEVFNNLLSFIDCKKDKTHQQIVTMIDDREPNIIFYYVWSKSCDFTYFGYVEVI